MSELSCLGCGQIGTPSTVHVPTGIYLCAERCVPALAAQPAAGEGLTAWLAMTKDVMGLWGTGEPDMDDVLETLAEHRPHVLRAALQPASEEKG